MWTHVLWIFSSGKDGLSFCDSQLAVLQPGAHVSYHRSAKSCVNQKKGYLHLYMMMQAISYEPPRTERTGCSGWNTLSGSERGDPDTSLEDFAQLKRLESLTVHLRHSLESAAVTLSPKLKGEWLWFLCNVHLVHPSLQQACWASWHHWAFWHHSVARSFEENSSF